MKRRPLAVIAVALCACSTQLLDAEAPGDGGAAPDLSSTTRVVTFVPWATPFERPGMVVAGDVDGDGRPDLVASDGACNNAGRGGTLHALLDQGNGAFAIVDSNVGAGQSLALGDFNRDGRPDVVTADFAVGLFVNAGGGRFAGAPGTKSVGVPVVADFDGDGNLDAFVPGASDYLEFGMQATLFRGDGNGGLKAYPVASSPITAAAFVGEGSTTALGLDLGGAIVELTAMGPTLAVASHGGSGYRNVIVVADFQAGAPGAIAFDGAKHTLDFVWAGGVAKTVGTASDVGALAVADLDGDGRLDLAGISAPVDQMGGASLFWMRGHGAVFDPPTTVASLAGTFLGAPLPSVAVADFDGDGRPDLATALPECGQVQIFVNR